MKIARQKLLSLKSLIGFWVVKMKVCVPTSKGGLEDRIEEHFGRAGGASKRSAIESKRRKRSAG